jgi:hypothetical protein
VLGQGAGHLRREQRPAGAARGRAGRHRPARLPGPRRHPVHHQADAQPRRLPEPHRHRPRSGRPHRQPAQPAGLRAGGRGHGDTRAIVLDAPEACPRYCGRIIRGVDAKAPTPSG